MTDHDKHLMHYLILVLGLITTGVLFLVFRYNYQMEVAIVAMGSIFYLFWGIIHHAMEHRLNRLVVLEYFFIGLLAFLLIFTALNL